MDSQSQSSTINSFSVTASSLATYPPDQSILATAAGSATWTDASQGQVTFTNVGWTSVNAIGSADLAGGTGWKYSFTSNVTGYFVVDYTVTAQGTSSNNPPLFGLNGFFIYGGLGQSSQGNVYDTTGLNTSGQVALAITPASSYWVQIQDSANIFGAPGTSDEHMNGTFNFGVQTEPGGNGGQSVPEPSSWIMMMFGLGFAGYANARRRVRSAH